MFQKLTKYLSKTTPAYPLGLFRMVFGLLMVFGAIRFMAFFQFPKGERDFLRS